MASNRLVTRSTFQWALLFCLGIIGFAMSQTTELPDSVVGIYLGPDGDTSLSYCSPGQTFTSEGSFAYCCASTEPSCDYVTRCVGTSADAWKGIGTWLCPIDFTCAVMTIMDKFPSATDSWVRHWCANSDVEAHTVYREIAATTTSSTTHRSQTSQTADPASSNWLSEASNTLYDDYTPMDSGESPSKAWIAGAVAGPVVALVALGAFAFWYRRRKQQTATTGGKYSPHVDQDDGYNQPYCVADPPEYKDAGSGKWKPTSTPSSWQGRTYLPVSELESVDTRYKAPILEAP
ncbi:hypothetical protein QBC45DRAFT_216517 [Copromyces sp. CBS 386.78]|nr:hypothetical protein QBC45DRAFT_216517 [Copromyces sp. CBS 386.78]